MSSLVHMMGWVVVRSTLIHYLNHCCSVINSTFGGQNAVIFESKYRIFKPEKLILKCRVQNTNTTTANDLLLTLRVSSSGKGYAPTRWQPIPDEMKTDAYIIIDRPEVVNHIDSVSKLYPIEIRFYVIRYLTIKVLQTQQSGRDINKFLLW